MTDAAVPKLDLKQILSRAQLPALPQSAIRLLELSQDPSNGPAEYAVPIESDPGLAGQVLRFVNSSYFGFSRVMPNPKCGPFDLKRLWQDSLRRALFARAMAKMLGLKEAEEPFAAALLQDMAVPVLAKEAPKLYVRLLQARDGGRFRLSYLEQRLFGWTHTEAGGTMARLWNLPDGFAELLEKHQAVDRWAAEPEAEPGRLAVALSALLPTTADPTWIDRELFTEYYRQVAPAGSPAVAELLGQIDREFAEFAPVLKLAAPSKSLVDSLNEMAASAL
jgi:HD-like signal output (HDOD) protein